MADKPELAIELEAGPWPDGQWRGFYPCCGELRGLVRVNSPQRIECRGVRVSLGWRTEGRGSRDTATVYAETLFAGELPIGEREFPFQATIPLGPISYTGHYINIIWFVAAHIDLAWKRDPKAERLLFVTLA